MVPKHWHGVALAALADNGATNAAAVARTVGKAPSTVRRYLRKVGFRRRRVMRWKRR